jgi:hypothetical protein
VSKNAAVDSSSGSNREHEPNFSTAVIKQGDVTEWGTLPHPFFCRGIRQQIMEEAEMLFREAPGAESSLLRPPFLCYSQYLYKSHFPNFIISSPD